MGRAPCCEKMGLKKGPWTSEEDQLLVNYIHLHGHSNWRALPKFAGLLRCGKSCRLRWINYLRPDIKRGNFTPEEEDTIINLHQMLGNRWSAIAAKLPGRTDNEIKNVWHTHLKKRLPKLETDSGTTATATVLGATKKRSRRPKTSIKEEVSEGPPQMHEKSMDHEIKKDCYNDNSSNSNSNSNNAEGDKVRPTSSIICDPISPQPCTSTSEVSTITTSTSGSENDNCSKENVVKKEGYIGDFPEFNDDFWMEVLSVEDTAISTEDLPSVNQCYLSDSPPAAAACLPESNAVEGGHSDDMDFFWYNLLTRPDDHLPEFSDML